MLFDILIYFIVFVSGLFIGSFLNLVSDRLEKGGDVLFGRSACDFCKTELSWRELIPIVTFLLQKGKCAKCGKKLSLYHPFSELMTGLVFLSFAYFVKLPLNLTLLTWGLFFFYIVLFSFFLIIFLSDLKFMIIPDKVVIPAIVFSTLSVLGSVAFYSYDLYKQLSSSEFGVYLIKAGFLKFHALLVLRNAGMSFAGAFGISLFFLLLIFLTKGRGMGGGDVKLGFLIGLVNGFPLSVVAIFLGFLIGAMYSLLLVLFKKKSLKGTIPFGPFLIIGSYLTVFFGNFLFEWYLRLL
ncbi:hypothetical protein A2716_00160 [candidate division WWE3 bacterium RIFCSPHIGHO2_01_FULL_40_23]|uniref:Prepilin peptidase n=1 Tax=candidate division WWE3 bacterium RIFCSPLOWO2_01_FULL_41_18 TaxID=1802625 RepID=A0A1F4VEP9_UNCKA|nr:MAG: hypothetical protein A2716_00160 [candidate division WWE3 bacterium RIFCSPHIGHO2_01_FULL_40_23]OGC55410.1 MAG: hypothetical protein A3A78_00430 [candidate division WWE3 bacterium RIFCSPLOWO2_01_FULL_41_18]